MKKKTIYIGIDTGVTGAIAAIDAAANIISVQDIPVVSVSTGKKRRTIYVESQMAALLSGLLLSAPVVVVTIENTHAMPQNGSIGGFSQGMGLGIWLGILAAFKIPVTRVEPARWKKDLLIPAGSDKNYSIVRALQLFPSATLDRKKDHGRADALLIADWGRRSDQEQRRIIKELPLQLM